MKFLKYISFFMLIPLMFLSCGEDESLTNRLEDGINVFTFTETVKGYSAIADGSEYTIDLKTKVTGPNMQNVSGAVTATMVVDTENSTAIEGTHYRIDNPNVTLSSDGDFLGIAQITMLTEGIATPLDESPTLVMSFADASGSSAVVGGGKKLKLTLNYACPSFLAGNYDVTVTWADGSYTKTDEVLREVGVGVYQGTYVAKWGDLATPPGYGIEFNDVCGVLTVPSQLLAGYYSNEFYGTKSGHVDPDTGVITLYYFVASGSGSFDYTAVYTPK